MNYYAINRDGPRFARLGGPRGAIANKGPEDRIWYVDDDATPPEAHPLGEDELPVLASQEDGSGDPEDTP